MAILQTYVHDVLFITFLLSCIFTVCGNLIYVVTEDRLIADEFYYQDLPSGGPDDRIEGFVVESQPKNACDPIQYPPYPANSTLRWFVLIQRNGCHIDIKLENAENAGFDAVIVYKAMEYKNLSVQDHVISDTYDASNITIIGIQVSSRDGNKIREKYLYSNRYYLQIVPDDSFNLFRYIIPFVIAVGICIIILMLFVVVKYIKERKRNQRNRLSSSHLKQLPVIKFKKGDQYDVCAICLEDYNEGNKLRVLPCSHAYHTKCIDPWLTNNRRTCPICKQKIRLEGMSSDSESDSENESPTETTPLLRSLAGRIAENRQRASNSGFLRNPVINSNRPDVIENGNRSQGESSQTAYRVEPTLEQQAGPFLQHSVHLEPHTGESDDSSMYSSLSSTPFTVDTTSNATHTGDNERQSQDQQIISAEQTSTTPASTSCVEVTVENADAVGKGKRVLKDMIV